VKRGAVKANAAFRASVKALTPESKMSPCCAAPLTWECFGGMVRVFRVANGRYEYSAKCSKCNMGFTILGDVVQ
jgi:hypothetical protein